MLISSINKLKGSCSRLMLLHHLWIINTSFQLVVIVTYTQPIICIYNNRIYVYNLCTWLCVDSVYVSLSPNDKGSHYNGKPNTGHSAIAFNNDQHDKNLYLPILPPTPDDIKKAEAKIERKLMRSSTAHDMPTVRK